MKDHGTQDLELTGADTVAAWRAIREAQRGTATRVTENGKPVARIIPAQDDNGPGRFIAQVSGNGLADMREAALASARELYGPDAPLIIEEVRNLGSLASSGKPGRHHGTFVIRCAQLPESWDLP